MPMTSGSGRPSASPTGTPHRASARNMVGSGMISWRRVRHVEGGVPGWRRQNPWYNDDHRHSGIGLHTPADVHYGRAEAIRRRRGVVLLDAYAEHPERFVRKVPTPPAIPAVAWINQPEEVTDSLNQ